MNFFKTNDYNVYKGGKKYGKSRSYRRDKRKNNKGVREVFSQGINTAPESLERDNRKNSQISKCKDFKTNIRKNKKIGGEQ